MLPGFDGPDCPFVVVRVGQGDVDAVNGWVVYDVFYFPPTGAQLSVEDDCEYMGRTLISIMNTLNAMLFSILLCSRAVSRCDACNDNFRVCLCPED